MESKQQLQEGVRVSVRNIGGISESDVAFDSGVTVLTGRNATNRTSFLQALMAALGSDDASLKGDADEGEVRLELDGETYTRRLSRRGGTVTFEGDPYLDTPERADLFAFLLESNEARQAVRASSDLREIIMRPVDTEEIQAQIDDATRRRDEIEARIDEVRDLKSRLPDLEQRRQTIERDIEAKRDELEEVREQIEDADASVEATRSAKEEFEEKLDELNDARNDLQRIESQLEARRQDLDELESEREHLDGELESVGSVSDARISELDDRLATLREERSALDSTINELQSIIRFNQNTLDDSGSELFAALDDGDDDGAVTDQLVDTQVTCWTCGTTVDESRIETTLDRLRDLRSEKMERRSTLDDEISEVKQQKAELEEKRRQRQQLHDQIDYIESELDTKRNSIDSLQDQREETQQRVEDLEADVDSFELDGREEILDLHTRANRLEFEIEQLEEDLDDVTSEITSTEEEVDTLDDLKERRERVREEIDDLRTRIDRIVESAVEEFNTHMETVLAILEYENLDRIWLERRHGGGSGEETFELHVVRTTEDGTSYEDTAEHLSESEREVVGLVFSLAGYLAHDVHEDVPFMILDSLEAIDAARVSALVEYLDQFSDYLLIALLPEDAAELDEAYTRIREI